MAEITIERGVAEDKLEQQGVFSWPVWSHDEAEFPWSYDETETCYFVEGEVTVTPQGGVPVTMGKGDLVTFPRGMACTWKITRAVRKHYIFP
ncbi:MAG: DUF861 domain-containing protein [Desulfovibrio sp.]|nr:MAG: DUF861 domain-containing protein [Desulfovibrio sp.]